MQNICSKRKEKRIPPHRHKVVGGFLRDIIVKRLFKKENSIKDLIRPEEQDRICAHEAGHLLMALNSFVANDIISSHVRFDKTNPGGCTKVAATYYNTEEELLDKCKIFYAGMIGEETLLGYASTGAVLGKNNDIEKVNELLRCYVMMYDTKTSYTGLDKNINDRIIKLSNTLISEVRTLFLANKHFLYKISELLKKKKILTSEDIERLCKCNNVAGAVWED